MMGTSHIFVVKAMRSVGHRNSLLSTAESFDNLTEKKITQIILKD